MGRTAPKLTSRHRELMDEAIQAGGRDALKGIRPLVLKVESAPGFSAKDAGSFLDPAAFTLTPAVNPLLEAVMIALGARPLGTRSFEVSCGEKANPQVIAAVLEALPVETLYIATSAEKIEKQGVPNNRDHGITNALSGLLSGTPAGANMSFGTTGLYGVLNAEKAHGEGKNRRCAVYVSEGKGRLYFKIATAHGDPRGRNWNFEQIEGVDLGLHIMRFGDVLDPVAVHADVAIAQVEAAVKDGWTVLDPTGNLRRAKNALRSMAVALPVPGSPGLSRLVVGDKASPNADNRPAASSIVGVDEVAATMASLRAAGVTVALDSRVADMARLAVAQPVPCADLVEPLRPFQQQMVGLHLSTTVGIVNSCAPGTGKTVMTLAALREKGLAIPQWRGLCVVPKTVVTQWAAEGGRFFSEATIVALDSRTLAKKLAEAVERAGIEPLLVICGYEAARRNLDALSAVEWDDLCLDEAAILTSVGSGRTNAMWDLREKARVAVALTGTPIDKSLDDLGKILAWARGEREMFHGNRRLSRRFVVSTEGAVEQMWKAIGASVFRRDRSAIADELPAIQTQTILLDPEPAEKALADGARTELRRMYDRLVTAVSAAEALDPEHPALAAAQAELRAARGAVLGGVTLARAACCDPMAVRTSESAGAALLDAAGLIEPAVAQGGTKRREMIKLVADLIDSGESVLMFTDFSSVCKSLAEELRERGVRCGTYSGKDTDKAREANKVAFMEGDLDCLILTGAGYEGLNLQRATVVVHYDLPWVPTKMIQRIGRAARFGSTAQNLQVLVPILVGTIEERVAAVLVPRAATALAALDVHRGVKASETEIGLAMNGIAAAVSDDEREGQESMFALAEAILAD